LLRQVNEVGCNSPLEGRLGRAGSFMGYVKADSFDPERLMRQIAGRDEKALSELYDRLAPSLFGLILRILGNREAAESTLEDCFLRVWKEASRFQSEPASVAAWLPLMARRMALERRRAAAGQDATPPASSFSERPAWLPSAEDVAALERRRELLKKIISQLPRPQREALDMAFFAGMTDQEIAAALGEPQAKVRSSLEAGMAFLRNRLRAVLGIWVANN